MMMNKTWLASATLAAFALLPQTGSAQTLDPAEWAHKLLIASEASYIDGVFDTAQEREEARQARELRLEDADLVEVAYVEVASPGDQEVLIAVDEDPAGPLVVAFAGSEPPSSDGFDPLDWLEDLQISLVKPTEGTALGNLCRDASTPCNVHMGFEGRVSDFLSHESGLAYLEEIIDRPENADRPLVITGHSLGGSLAQLSAAYLAADGVAIDAVITYGSTMVGDAGFKSVYEDTLGLDGVTERWVIRRDPGPMYPREIHPAGPLAPAVRADYREAGPMHLIYGVTGDSVDQFSYAPIQYYTPNPFFHAMGYYETRILDIMDCTGWEWFWGQCVSW